MPGVSHRSPAEASSNVLLVDDDDGLRTSLAMLLTASGHRAIEAAGGQAALRLLGETKIDVVITDLDMAEVTGWDVARAAKECSPSLPVILLTGWGDQVATVTPITADVDAILAKPFRLDALLQMVAEFSRG